MTGWGTRGRLRAALTVGIGMTALLAVACTSGGGTVSSQPSTAPSTAAPAAGTGAHAGHGPATTPVAAPLRTGERFVDVTMATPYTPKAPNGGTDEYRC